MDRKAWEPLHRFESRDYLSKYYKDCHARSLSAQRAHEIGACFTQSREYFASAAQASATVKPLLLYYGIASMSRGVTLLKNKNKNEENLAQAHGLTTIEWQKTLATGLLDILDLKVQCTNGGFSEFVTAVGNGQSYQWRNKSLTIGGFKHNFGDIRFLNDKSAISLNDLLSRERELIGEYNVASDSWGNMDTGYVVALDDSVSIYLQSIHSNDPKEVIKSYHFPASATVSVQPHPLLRGLRAVCVNIPATGEGRKSVLPMAIEQDTNLGWLIRPFPNGDNIIDIHRLFMEAYILGMLCRYFPSKWVSLIRSEKGDIARSVILAAMERIELKFPLLVRSQMPS